MIVIISIRIITYDDFIINNVLISVNSITVGIVIDIMLVTIRINILSLSLS